MRSEEEANRAVDLYGDTVRRICMIHLKNRADTVYTLLTRARKMLKTRLEGVTENG